MGHGLYSYCVQEVSFCRNEAFCHNLLCLLLLHRYCLGAALAMAEMKVFLSLLARHYSFTADNNTEWKPALGFYPANGLPLILNRL